MINFSVRLKELMILFDKSHKDIAKHLNLKYENEVYSWTRNKSNPKIDKAIMLADLFNCSLDYLLGRSNDLSNFTQSKPLPEFDIQLKKIFYKSLYIFDILC